jgi:hypothetical protein
MAIAALALSAVGSAVGIGSTIMQGNAANNAARAQAKSIEAEQKNKQLEFIETMNRERDKSRRALSTIRARLAQTGTDTTAGTPLQILGESAQNIETSFQDAARSQFILDQSLTGARAMARFQGHQARTSAMISAGGQLLGATGQLGTQYSRAVRTGAMRDTFGIYTPPPLI